jgi:Ala-tRNA(Pro) deacylase
MKQYTPEMMKDHLDAQGFEYSLHEHPAVFTVDEAAEHTGHLVGGHCKNLFVKDKKSNMWLITVSDETRVDLKALGKMLGAKASLSFANEERLDKYLGVKPGSVTPLSLIHDSEGDVTAVIEEKLTRSDVIYVHPLINTMTVGLKTSDLMKFYDSVGGVTVMELPEREVS